MEIEAERHSRKRKLGSQELQVRLTVLIGNSKVLLVFAYLPEMDVITARLSDKDVQHQHLLSALYPDDTGDSWPGNARPDVSTLAHANARPYRCVSPLLFVPYCPQSPRVCNCSVHSRPSSRLWRLSECTESLLPSKVMS